MVDMRKAKEVDVKNMETLDSGDVGSRKEGDSGLKEMGRAYTDPKSGKMYIIVDTGKGEK